MKNSMLYVVIAALTLMFLTSCGRYEVKNTLNGEGIAKDVPWITVVHDSVKTDIVRYFTILGKDNRPKVSEILIHRQFGIVHVPNVLVKDIASYHDCFYMGEPMIAENEYHRTSGPTLWYAPKVTFTLKVMDPINFDQATLQIVERDARIFWQVVIVILFLFFFLFIFVSFDSDESGWGIVCIILSTGMGFLSWYYLSYFLSGLLSLIVFIVIILSFWGQIKRVFTKSPKKAFEDI